MAGMTVKPGKLWLDAELERSYYEDEAFHEYYRLQSAFRRKYSRPYTDGSH